MTKRQERRQRARRKIVKMRSVFIQAFDTGGRKKAEEVLKLKRKQNPQESHVALAAFQEVKAIATRVIRVG